MRRLAFFLVFFLLAVTGGNAQSPYAGAEQRPVRSLSDAEIASLRAGDGMGFALLAELNSYPGPRHVLELADKLELTAEQRARTETLFADMQRRAISLGESLVELEAALDARFAAGDIDSATLRAALDEISDIRAALRHVHLAAHLEQKALLSDAQVRAYDRLRGYHDHARHHGSH